MYIELFLYENVDISNIKIDIEPPADDINSDLKVKEDAQMSSSRKSSYSEVMKRYQTTPFSKKKHQKDLQPSSSAMNSSERKRKVKDVLPSIESSNAYT